MADIKSKKKHEISIKKINRATIIEKSLKSNIVALNNKESYERKENTPQEYVQSKVKNSIQNTSYYIPYLYEKGKEKFNETKNNFLKEKIEIKKIPKNIKEFKSKIKLNKNTKKIRKKFQVKD